MFKPMMAILLLGSLVANGQSSSAALTDHDYARAEQFLSYNLGKYVDRGSVQPNWIDGSDFWYRVLTAGGSEYVFVDAQKGTRKAALIMKGWPLPSVKRRVTR